MNSIDESMVFELSREFSATQGALFDAFINPDTLKGIWGVSSILVDAKPGGHARATLTIAGENWDFTITYQEVTFPETLRWVVRFDRFPSKETWASLFFRATAGGSKVKVRMENFDSVVERDSNRQAWEGALTKLEAIIVG